MKKNPYFYSSWILILGALVSSGLITIGASAATLSTEALEIVRSRNIQLREIREKKETFFADFEVRKIAFKNYKEQWSRALNGLMTFIQVRDHLNRLAAESNLMLKEKASTEGTMELEVTGEMIPLMEWLSQVEREFFTLKIIEVHFRSDPRDTLTAVLVLQYFNVFESVSES